ncbi:MAG: imidazoleglycerol-phosphate dehydratase HisB [Candidatus Omnitrophota bacterium]
MKKRSAAVRRKTKETDIEVKVVIDGSGKSAIKTGVGFLNHMLELFAHHGLFDLTVLVKRSDLDVDLHHTNEDIGICMGQAFKKALGGKRGIKRFGFYAPMDEALAAVVLDISGRPSLYFDLKSRYKYMSTRDYSIIDAREFLKALAFNCGVNMHVDIIKGEDAHHILEAIFKALAKALDGATQIDRRRGGALPSTKGKL